MIIGSNFKLSSKKFLDNRQQCQSYSMLVENSNNILYPQGFEVYCIQEEKYYQNVSNTDTPNWVERPSGGNGERNVDINIEDIIDDTDVFTDKTWSSEYIDGLRVDLETLITSNEDYIAEIEDRLEYVEGELQWFETFDGSWDSLTNKPTIPTKISELEDDSNFLTTDELNEELAKLTDVLEELQTNLEENMVSQVQANEIDLLSILEDEIDE